MTAEIMQQQVTGERVELDGESFYRIANSHLMPDFFMSLVGAGDHWMFVSSSGALTAGRCDPDNALFPYATDDQISAAQAQTGCVTLIRTESDGTTAPRNSFWEPFATHGVDFTHIRRNLYKNALGSKLVFEEINDSLQLVFRYRWVFSRRFGFVRSCRLQNLSSQSRRLELLDGLRNVLPWGVGSEFMMRYSNLANAYKKNELLADSGVGLFYLSSIPTDRAEPSEGLKATTVWQTGLTPQAVLLSTQQVADFKVGRSVRAESDIRGTAGAYLVQQSVDMGSRETMEWQIVADLAQDHADVIDLQHWLTESTRPAEAIAADIDAGEQEFLRIISSADAVQCGASACRSQRHLSNTVFNVMRGGVPLEDYAVHVGDFQTHAAGFNRDVVDRCRVMLESLPPVLNAAELRSHAEQTGDADLLRLVLEYLPLAFSRRHGDPTRPWNRFAIHLDSENGRTNLDYQGNWRDIFQNWEALAVSFPGFTSAMVCRFVNATTADGYNPYRLTRSGFEWEEPSPDDPWANIGYWSDHQIIYLLKLLEWNRRTDPDELNAQLNRPVFVHANVPYRIRGFEAMRQNPRATIEFDAALSEEIAERVAQVGADGKLLRNSAGELQRVTLMEKLLTLTLAKLSSFVPDGGIWLNTQRPEWNDANNALVGNGLSMVTTCYLHRWCDFLIRWLAESAEPSFQVSQETADWLAEIAGVLKQHSVSVGDTISPLERQEIVTSLSRAGGDYRSRLYDDGLSGQMTELPREHCQSFFENAGRHLEATIRSNRRPDGLYHAYNLLDWRDDGIEIEHLYEMLEGQVAVLSAGLLSASEVVDLLDVLRDSSLYRENQNSYLLYPDRQLPRFLEKNHIGPEHVSSSPLLRRLLTDGNEDVVRRDVRGGVHFNGLFRNAADLQDALDTLPACYESAVNVEAPELIRLFEDLFEHRRFTGRSCTFFAYEGLGSIYWHMVSKLGLAVAENFFRALDKDASDDTVAALRDHFRAVRSGIGAEKSPAEYGAFPSDPYSHTPENAGVKQPGMTGQVKEDILSRFAEIGVHVDGGCLSFRMDLFDRDELVPEPREFTYCGLDGEFHTLEMPPDTFAFTLCQVPVSLQPGPANTILVHYTSGHVDSFECLQLDASTTRKLFSRSGEIRAIDCRFSQPIQNDQL